jgi:hypothetical protein
MYFFNVLKAMPDLIFDRVHTLAIRLGWFQLQDILDFSHVARMFPDVTTFEILPRTSASIRKAFLCQLTNYRLHYYGCVCGFVPDEDSDNPSQLQSSEIDVLWPKLHNVKFGFGTLEEIEALLVGRHSIQCQLGAQPIRLYLGKPFVGMLPGKLDWLISHLQLSLNEPHVY